MMLDKRPPLPPLAVGDELLVIRSNGGRGRTPEPVVGEVVKVGRVWVTVLTGGEQMRGSRYHEQRYRIETQRTENGTNYNDRFATREQHAFDEALAAVEAVLRDAGVRLGQHGTDPRWTTARRAALADLIVSLGVLNG